MMHRKTGTVAYQRSLCPALASSPLPPPTSLSLYCPNTRNPKEQILKLSISRLFFLQECLSLFISLVTSESCHKPWSDDIPNPQAPVPSLNFRGLLLDGSLGLLHATIAAIMRSICSNLSSLHMITSTLWPRAYGFIFVVVRYLTPC